MWRKDDARFAGEVIDNRYQTCLADDGLLQRIGSEQHATNVQKAIMLRFISGLEQREIPDP
jgi:hypothetical protein